MEIRDGGKSDTERPSLQQVIGEAIASHAGRHPGIIAGAVVERISATFTLIPRELHHRERRKNHRERIRRFSCEVYHILADTQDIDPAREIAARVLTSFILARRAPSAAGDPGDGP